MANFTLAVASYLLLVLSFWNWTNAFKLDGLQNRIVGGVRVKHRHQFPYQVTKCINTTRLGNDSFLAKGLMTKIVSLRLHGQHICGATIYKTQWIVTAAHCVVDAKASQLKVVAGDLNLRRPDSKTQSLAVEKIIIHENYTDFVNNDVAVLKLSKNFTFNSYVNEIKLFDANTTVGQCVVSGWGSTVYNGPLIADLQQTNVEVYSQRKCMDIYSQYYVPDLMLCAGDIHDSRDACNGDSGGPLVCNGHLYGIVSWGYQCGLPSYPGVYTNASHYAQWINAKTNDAGPSCTFNLNAVLFISLLVTIQNKLSEY